MEPRQALQSISERVEHEGSQELKRHWHVFRRLREQPEPIDSPRLAKQTTRHTQPLLGMPRTILVAIGVISAALTWGVMRTSFADLRVPWLRWTTAAWTFPSLFGLAIYLVTMINRYLLVPMEPLLARQLARVLNASDFRDGWLRLERTITTRQRIAKRGVNETWDDPSYVRWYQKVGSQWTSRRPITVRQSIHQSLVDFLGSKDAETRKFQPGRYLESLRDGKRSVTRFIKTHGSAIRASREENLDESDGVRLLEQLLAEEVRPDTRGAQVLSTSIQTMRSGRPLPTGGIGVAVWQRCPWRDLTHQQEFYSSASLRGVQWVGRSSKGRLSPFLYLDNAAISAIDFSDATGRKVRARVAAVVLGQSQRAALYVDGIEGSNSIPRSLAVQTLRDYAHESGFEALVVHRFPHNQVPRHFVMAFAQWVQPSVVSIRYLDDSHREYLDGFGWPVEPFEYAFPRGEVCAHVLPCDAANGSAPSAPAAIFFGRPTTWADTARYRLKRASLWFLMTGAIGYAALSISITTPWLLVPLAIGSGIAIAAHLRFQGLSMRRDS